MTNASSKTWNIGLWIAQGLLGSMFLMAGIMKSTQPIEALTPNLPWVSGSNILLVRFIGISELAAALGLILPWLLKIQPKLTVYAALGLVLVMVLASGFHAIRGEYQAIGFNVVLGGLAGLIAYGRSFKS